MNFDFENNIVLPIVPLKGLVVFPNSLIHFDVGRDKSLNAIKKSMKDNQLIFLTAQKNIEKNEPEINDLYNTGVIAKIIQIIKQPDNSNRVVLDGVCRASIVSPVFNEKYLFSEVKPYKEDESEPTVKEMALIRLVKNEFMQYIKISPKVSPDIVLKVTSTKSTYKLVDYITSNILLDYTDKQTILSTFNNEERIEYLFDLLVNENSILKIEDEIAKKTKDKIDKNQKEYFLREQKNIIEMELGEDENPQKEAEVYCDKILSLKLDDRTTEYLLKEVKKIERMPFGSQELSVIRTYLDTVLDLPWNNSSKDKINIEQIQKKLDKSHFGLQKVKDKIIEQFAVMQLNSDQKGQIICLVGPPGVGKTSIAQSIANAVGKKCERIALGGVKDESEIRGHRKTYIGSMPGRIINAIKSCKTNNPLLILDEIDKLSNDYKGDPTSALLEVLDSEQNNKYVDHYLDIPFDLSNVMFIATANDISSIPRPLIDRMEIIEIDSYTMQEKLNIAKKYLLPKQIKLNGFTSKEVKFSNKSLLFLIDFYTRESGVRNLERLISTILKKCAVIKLKDNIDSFKIDDKFILKLLGNKKYINDNVNKKDEIGLVNGLAWTSVGGELLPIEVSVMDGTGKLELTGSLGDVMQESAKTALTCIRSHANDLNISSDFYKNKDIHIHAPEGAVPKDGPSAGITMATAIYSALSSNCVRCDVAMTGEITLRGKVLPIGGLKEKSMAAYKSGIHTVIIPKQNEKDIEEIDKEVTDNIKFVPVSDFTEVLSLSISNQ